MAINKVVLSENGVERTLIDITDTTADASDVASGKYFYAANGVKTEGTASGGGSGEGYTIDDIAERNMMSGSIYGSSASYIGLYAFYSAVGITAASFPVATTISSYAFASCTNLATISFPNATSIGAAVFQRCSKLTDVSLPQVINTSGYAFQYCSSLRTISIPKATSIGDYFFGNCSNLTIISLPSATRIGNQAFAGMTRIIF